MKKLFAVVTALMLMAGAAQAHVGVKEESESSFWNPVVLDDPGNSMTLYGYLYPFDIDVIEFEIPPAMKPIMDSSIPPQIIGWEPVMIPVQVPILDADGKLVMDFTQRPPRPLTEPVFDKNGAPLMAPLAAEQILINPMANTTVAYSLEDFYVSVGLSGPGLPGHSEYSPAGLLMGFNEPAPAGAERPAFTMRADEFNDSITRLNSEQGCNVALLDEDTNLSMYMPYGMTQECIHCSPWTCDTSNMVTWYSVYAGTYKVYLFNSSGQPGDYIYSQGLAERFTCEQLEETADLMDQAVNGGLFHATDLSDYESGYDGCPAPPY
jgi:hypothetical protein